MRSSEQFIVFYLILMQVLIQLACLLDMTISAHKLKEQMPAET